MAADLTYTQEVQETAIGLRQDLRVILKRRRVALTVFAVIMAAAALKNCIDTPIYRTTTRLVIERNVSSALTPDEMMIFGSFDQEYYNTHYEIIKSRAVAEVVVASLGLKDKGVIFAEPKDSPVARYERMVKERLGGWKRSFVSIFTDDPLVAEADTLDAAGETLPPVKKPVPSLLAIIRDGTTVTPVPDSLLVDVSFEAEDPRMAAVVANAVAQAYIDLTRETRLKGLKDAVQWIGERIAVERSKVEQAELALLRFKEEQGIITGFGGEVEQVTAQKLAELSSQVVAAEAQRVEAETLYAQAASLKGSSRLIDSITVVSDSHMISEIKRMELEGYKRLSQLSEKYGPNHPRMVALKSELRQLERRKAPEAERVVNYLKNRFEVALAKEKWLREAFEQQRQNALLLNEKALQYNLLSRKAQYARDTYYLLVRRFKAITQLQHLQAEDIRVIDKAEVPGEPVRPNRPRLLLLAVLAGLTLGVGAALFLEYLDNTIKAPEDLGDHMGVALLGRVPVLRSDRRLQDCGSMCPELIRGLTPHAIDSQAYHRIRTNLLFSCAGAIPQVILVASSAPGEGKSLTTANLAVAMGQAGIRTLVIDCDLRKPRMHKLFGMKSDRGITTLLAGADGLGEAIQATQFPCLDLIPCGPLPPNPSEMLGSARMAQILATLRKTYDRVLIDSPPTSAVTDAVVISKLVDGVVLVVRAGSTVRKLAAAAVTQIRMVGGRILGVVLNAADTDGGCGYGGNESARNKINQRRRGTAS